MLPYIMLNDCLLTNLWGDVDVYNRITVYMTKAGYLYDDGWCSFVIDILCTLVCTFKESLEL